MAAACPVAFVKVDEHQVRALALIVTLVSVTFIWSEAVWLLALLVYDFAVRVFGRPKQSPLFHASRGLIALMPFEPVPVDAGPKKFAAKIGLIFVITAGLFALFGYTGIAMWLMVLMALFAALESACGFCVGCKLYTLLLPLVNRI